MTIKVGNGTVNCEIPDIPNLIRGLFPFESKIGQIRAQDLADEIVRLANLDFKAAFQCENPPTALDKFLVGDCVLPGNAVLCDVLFDVRDRSAGIRWRLVRSDAVNTGGKASGGPAAFASTLIAEDDEKA
jgi:hypothetical protein